MKKIDQIVLIGSGNVACFLASEMKITQCYARDKAKAKAMGLIAGSAYTSSLNDIKDDADLYLIAISDDAIEPFCQSLIKHISPSSIVAHTSGTMPLDALCAENRAVFYPLQRFVKGEVLNFHEIPLLIEGSSKEVEESLIDFAKIYSNRVVAINSEKRRELHIAAVLTCNFTNHLYSLAWRYLQKKGLSFDLLKPLITESIKQVISHNGDISDLQTGPAARGDKKTMNAHLEMLNNDENLTQIYKLLSNSIINGKF
ncbi:MAG: DUF2520 domain-containing protein [Rikenellaceae bacterium]